MADSTGPVLAAGAIVFASGGLLAPLAGRPGTWNWRVIPAAAGLAVGLALLERLSHGFAVGLAWLTLATALILPAAGGQPPLTLASEAMGLAGKAA